MELYVKNVGSIIFVWMGFNDNVRYMSGPITQGGKASVYADLLGTDRTQAIIASFVQKIITVMEATTKSTCVRLIVRLF